MKTPILAYAACAVLLLSFSLHTTVAGAFDSVAGTTTLNFEHMPTGRKVTSELWFPAAPDSRIEWFSPRAPLRSIPIARDAKPQTPLLKRPLVVISHGNWGSRFSQGWLALELVKAGYVV